MSSETEGSLGERAVEAMEWIHGTYERVESRGRTYTPYVVRTLEVVLAIALLAVLAHWIYWVYITGG